VITCTLNRYGVQKLRARYPRVHESWICNMPPARPGTLVDLADERGAFLARGYAEPGSTCPVRILSFRPEEISAGFFRKRFEEAAAFRQERVAGPDTDVYRIINEEGDHLSGLAVDRYGAYLLVQFFSHGIEAFAEPLFSALEEIFRPAGIYRLSRMSRSKLYPREPRRAHPTQLARGIPAPGGFCVRENGLRFLISFENGAKTGLYLDMRENRSGIRQYCAGRTVLNTFSYTASFSVYAANAGARKTTNIDLSRKANDWGKKNFELNGLDPQQHLFITDDVFDVMKRCEKRGDRFDAVILDPPTFSKGLKKVYQAERDYGQLCACALRLAGPGGIVACALNAEELSEKWFLETLAEAGRAAGKKLQVIGRGAQGADYRFDNAFPEGRYLKYAVVRAGA